jgi:hypothetical protein
MIKNQFIFVMVSFKSNLSKVNRLTKNQFILEMVSYQWDWFNISQME